jgi:hypothetical protein
MRTATSMSAFWQFTVPSNKWLLECQSQDYRCSGKTTYVRFGSEADIEARPRNLPLYPQKRTLLSANGMSAKCHKRTSDHPYSITSLARAINLGGTITPSTMAVFMLTTGT